MKLGFQSRWWGTYLQWKELKGQVRKGEKGTRVVFWRAVDKEINPNTGKPDRFFVMRSYVLFNLDQVDGDSLDHLRPSIDIVDEQSVTVDWEIAEQTLGACNATEQFGGDKAYYRRSDDSIQIPHRSRFPQLADFYATRFHEYGHWACNERRLNIEPPKGTEGRAAYAFEELVVEVATCFLASELNLPSSEDTANHEAYLASWLRSLENDPSWILKASSAASKVVDHIQGYSGKGSSDEQESFSVQQEV